MKRVALLASLTTLLLSACGGGGSAAPPANPQPSGATVQINLGDDPADRVLAAAMTIDAIALTGAGAASVSVLNTPRPMELMQSMGTVMPLALASVPTGTYTGAMLTFGAATITYVDPATGQPVQRTVPGPMTANVTFGSPLAAGTTPMVVNLDMNVAASIAIDAGNHVALTPTLRASMNPFVAGSIDPEDGGMHGVTGMVGGIGGNAFTLTAIEGMSGMSLLAGAATQFAGMSGMGMMGNGMLITLDASLQPDGSWMASRVQSRMGAGGAMAAGLVTRVNGTPPTQLTLVMQDGVGNGMTAANLAGTTTVNIDEATQFAIDAGSVDLSNLPFTPRFDRLSLGKGQRVYAFSAGRMMQGGGMGGMMGGATLAATSLQLGMQGLRGTVAGYSRNGVQATFTLALPVDSAFAKLAGVATVTVYQQGATQLRGSSTIADGSTVLVRGLLFFDGGVARMVAGRIVGS